MRARPNDPATRFPQQLDDGRCGLCADQRPRARNRERVARCGDERDRALRRGRHVRAQIRIGRTTHVCISKPVR